LKSLITVAFRLGGRQVPEGQELELEVKVWEYALGDVPTHHLEECFRRAIHAKTDSYMVLATEIRKQYQEMLPELAQQAREASDRLALQAGYDDADRAMGAREWKEKHNLPATWSPTDGYPPESDLYEHGPDDRLDEAEADIRAHPPKACGRDGRWHVRSKMPWELYPPADNPRVVMAKGMDGKHREFVWWVDECVEEINPADRCPGYILEHHGPGGQWINRKECPIHGFRRWQK
jgi:hypothetical protein